MSKTQWCYESLEIEIRLRRDMPPYIRLKLFFLRDIRTKRLLLTNHLSTIQKKKEEARLFFPTYLIKIQLSK